MKAEGYSLEYVDVMIDILESKIEGHTITPAVLDALQKRLDKLAAIYRSDQRFAGYYPHMLELQTLIYGEGNQEEKALQYLKEAVRQTGSARGLYSKLLKRYIVHHSRPASVVIEPVRRDNVISSQENRPQRRKFFAFGKVKIGVATAFGLVAVTALTLHFVPRAAAVPVLLARHSQIAHEKQVYDSLSEQYSACSSSLAQRKGTINPNDLVGVDTYNKDANTCNDTLQQLRQAAERYNSLSKL